ncbi:hypothetical protein OEI98_000321 [Thermoanaerobacter sp. RKWS2]|nr:hypothetical protein [Thermoanaerobacter sp. RKWS2]UZQ83289.1 hypothetical protein OEI98_000321 [Thermoanaerobacter sp. RKWS2]
MAHINTVLGEIKAEDLGFTYSHEHLIAHPPDWKKGKIQILNYQALNVQ